MKKGKYNVNLEAIYRLQIKRKKETKSRRNSGDKGRQGERDEPYINAKRYFRTMPPLVGLRQRPQKPVYLFCFVNTVENKMIT